MSLFFIIAGVTYKQKSLVDFTIAKINRIFIPWIFWSVISGILNIFPHGYGGPFNGPLWFLQNIFTALIIMYIVCSLQPQRQLAAFISIVALSTFVVVRTDICAGLPFNLILALISFQFIWIGHKASDNLIKLSNNGKFIYIVFITSVIGYLWISHYLQNTDVIGSYVSLQLFRANYWGTYSACFFGSLSIITLSQIIGKSKFLEWMGKNSLTIMCVHFPFCMLLDGYLVTLPVFSSQINKLVIACSEWTFVIIVSSILSILCHRFIPQFTGYNNLLNVSRKNTFCRS